MCRFVHVTPKDTRERNLINQNHVRCQIRFHDRNGDGGEMECKSVQRRLRYKTRVLTIEHKVANEFEECELGH